MNIECLLSDNAPTFKYAGQYDGTRSVPDHNHADSEVLYIHRGEAIVKFADRTIRASEGTLVYIPPGEIHDQKAEKHTSNDYVVFSLSKPLLPSVVTFTGEPARMGGILVRTLVELQRDPGDVPEAVAAGVLYSLCTVLTIPGIEGESMLYPSKAVQNAVAYVQVHLSRRITLADMANAAYVSPGHLIRLFNAEVGVSPIEYLQTRRLNIAKSMLRMPYSPIQAVAAKCGYSDPSYFSRVFRAHTGMSPHEYRKGALREGAGES